MGGRNFQVRLSGDGRAFHLLNSTSQPMSLPLLYHFSCSTRASIHRFDTPLTLQSIHFKSQRHLAIESLDCPILCLQYGKIAEHNSPTLVTCQDESRMSFLKVRTDTSGAAAGLDSKMLALLVFYAFSSSYFRDCEEGSRFRVGKKNFLVFQKE